MAGDKRYRVGGLSHDELKNLVDKVKKKGAKIDIVEEAKAKRFGLQSPEFTVSADEKAVVDLLESARVVMGMCGA